MVKEWLQIIKQIVLSLTTPHPKPPPQTEKLKEEIFYEIMSRRLETQSQTSDTNKALSAAWVQASSLILAFPGVILANERDELRSLRALVPVIFGGVLYIIALFVILSASRPPKNWLSGPNWEQLEKATEDPRGDARAFYRSVARSIGKYTLPLNNRTLETQLARIWIGVSMALIAVCILLLVAVIHLPSHPMASSDSQATTTPRIAIPSAPP